MLRSRFGLDARFDQEASKALLCLEPVIYLKPVDNGMSPSLYRE